MENGPRTPERLHTGSGTFMRGTYSLTSVFGLLRKHWALFYSVGLVVALLVIAFSFVFPLRFTAEACVRIDPSNKSVLDLSAAYGRAPDAALVDTEVNEILSRPVAESAVKRLDLQHTDEFGPHPSLWRRLLGLQRPVTEDGRFDGAVDAVLKHLQVSREGTSYRVVIRFSSQLPTQAVAVVDAIVEAYLQRSRDLQAAAAASQANTLNEQLKILAESVRAADAALAKYRAETGLGRASSTGPGTINDQQITSISAQLAAADATAAESTSRANAAKLQAAEKGADNVGEVLASPVVTELRKQRAEIIQEQAQILRTLGPSHPDSLRVAKQLSDLDGQIEQEARRIISGLESSARSASSTAKNLREQLQLLQAEQGRNLGAGVQADSLERDAQAKRTTYEHVAQAAQQIGEDLMVPVGRLSSLAALPRVPSFPNKSLFGAIGLFLGAVLGLAAVFAADAFDCSVRNPRFLTEHVGIPYMGSIPALSLKDMTEFGAASPGDFVTRRPRSAYAESLRNIRASLMTRLQSSTGQVICITSALPREGKSTFALSLARIMAISGDKVILIDGDKHRSSLRAFVLNAAPVGLLEVLRDKSKLPNALSRDVTGLHLLLQTEGDFVYRDLLGGVRMRTLLSVLSSAYRFVIVDAPPVLAVADACSLASAADKCLLVVKWGDTSRAAVEAAVQRLDQANVVTSGTILLQVDVRSRSERNNAGSQFYYENVRDYYN